MRRERISTDGTDSDPLLDRLCRLDQQVIYFPVRHHSPACALFLGQLIRQTRNVREQLTNGDTASRALRKLGYELLDRVFKTKLALVIECHQSRRGHRLRD